MATVDKAFRIKNGLVVEGATATVNGSTVLTEASTEFLQDTTAAMFDGAQSGISFSYNDGTGKITATVSTTPTFDDRIIFEGAVPDAYELTLLAPEPVADVTVTLPNATTTLVGTDTTDTFSNKTFNAATSGNVLQIQGNAISSYSGSGNVVILQSTPTISGLWANNGINFNGATTGYTTLQAANTASGTITLPAVTGTVITTGDTGTVTNTMLAGSIANNKLTNSSVSINGSSVSLGGSTTITAVNPNALTIGTGLSGTSYDGSSAVTVAIDSTVATTSGTQTLTNKTLTSPVVDGNGVVFEGATANEFETTLTVVDPTADNTITLPNVTGTVITTGDSGTVTNTMLAGSIANDKLSNSAITINGVSTSLGGTRTLGTDDVAEGSTNKYFTDERAQDAVAAAIAAGTQTNITITYDDNLGSLSFNASGGVSSLTGTANEVEVSASTGAVTIGLPDNVTIGGNITINGTPTNSTHAATVGYVDAIAQGLHIHASCVTATTSNIDLSSDLQTGDVIDGVTLAYGDRVLVKNQSTTSENGIYTAVTSGAAVRATDFNSSSEIQGGDFVFVTGGTYNDNTGWVQTEKVTTVGTDPIVFTQFSGAGTYNAGNGLTLTGNVFSINTGVTVDLNTAQTLTNKTLTSPVLNTPSISGPLILGNNIVIEGTDDTHETTLTFTDPTQDNTITFKDASGTVAFLSDIESAVDGFGNAVTGSTGISVAYASTSNVLTITNTDTGSAQNIFKTIAVGGDSIVADSNSDTLTVTSGTGITLSANTSSDTLTIGNSGVTSLAGTTDQVSVSASTGSVTLSLPQNIATSSSPTFAGLSVGSGSVTSGSITLTDALIGTATTSISSTSATIVDTWSATSYRSAKYLVQMRNGDDIEVIEVLVTTDNNNNVYLTEYADVQSNTQIGTVDADYNSGNVRLLVSSTNGTTVKVHKTLIEA